jgi:predicted nucleic acid-binding Zn ribbon protein
MSKMLFDFSCNNHHTTEYYIDSTERQVLCPVCGDTAKRITSPVSTVFKGTGFPDADDKWARAHERAAKQ